MIHKSYFPAQAGTSASKMAALAKTLAIEDERIEAILKSETDIPDEKWALHQLEDVTFTAAEAVKFCIAHDICDFQVPPGNQLYNI